MPKVLITQEVRSRRNLRTVVDGQQRIRAILGFIDGDFRISSAHNREYARMEFEDLPEEIQDDILKYEISCDLLYDMPYRELLDIFARINTFTVKLNQQELLNAKYLGYFKQFAYNLGFDYVDYFVSSKVLSKAQVSRMAEATLASDMLIALSDGVQTNKNMENIYKKYEDEPGGIDKFVGQFNTVMRHLAELYAPEELAGTNWRRVHMFYTLFTTIAHGLFGLKGLDSVERPKFTEGLLGKNRSVLDEISIRYDEYTVEKDKSVVPEDFRDFIDKSRRRTTDTASRVDRARFVCEELRQAVR